MSHDHDHDDYGFEKDYWGTCCNTFDEDQKQYVYARLMGLQQRHWSIVVPEGTSVLDIGGGPTSMLLKTTGLSHGKVVDPIEYPQWTRDRYKMMNIEVDVKTGEDVTDLWWDEVWIYNYMQHAIDPGLIIDNAKRAAKVLRLFEWIDIPAHDGHPHELTEKALNKWIGATGGVTTLGESGCYGKAYFGVFEF